MGRFVLRYGRFFAELLDVGFGFGRLIKGVVLAEAAPLVDADEDGVEDEALAADSRT